jgi:ribosomal protein S18 acetylase RimI-like enzyme
MQARIRNAGLNDLPAIVAVEEAVWPADARASSEQFASRLEHFPEGFLVAEAGQRIVAVCTSCLIHYDPGQVDQYTSWSKLTNNGFLSPLEQITDPNAVYIVSNGILPEYRRKGLREMLVGAQIDLSRRLQMDYAVTGAMLPGYDAWCREHGDVPAREYAFTEHDGVPVDPTLRKLGALGLKLPGVEHVIPGYYPNQQSRDYGVLLVCKNITRCKQP